MKIYTRSGDQGETALFGGPRVSKDHDRIEAYGTVDELNAVLGLARTDLAEDPTADVDELLGRVQHQLFDLGAELATPTPEEKGTALLTGKHIADLEGAIDHYDSELPALTQFILPGGTRVAAQLHLARCVCRRAERLVVALGHHEALRETPMQYLNRLSDLLFILARVANERVGHGDVSWSKEV
ncbi:MAG: cob(I)yrinic acid a,c-diamide adenosyltransferase [Planctomycetota bacterium]